jgi:dCTP deaminase
MSIFVSQVAKTAVAPELEKIDVLIHRKISPAIKSLCRCIAECLKNKSIGVQDTQDLIDLRYLIETVAAFTKLILASSTDLSSLWATPLIKQCYQLCDISYDREILIIHSGDVDINEFGVYSDIVGKIFGILTGLSDDIDSSLNFPLDIFVIPAEVDFDIPSIALVSHEVGHVYWLINRVSLNARISELLPASPPGFEKKIELAKITANHIEEYFCDQIGRYLLGTSFDFALIQLFSSFVVSEVGTPTHPSTKSRISKSLHNISQCLSNSHGRPYHDSLVKIYNDLPKYYVEDDTSDDQMASQSIAEKLYEETGFDAGKRISDQYLDSIWSLVKKELDDFRPPFEGVSIEKPICITPIDALIVTTLYFYGCVYEEKNKFYISSKHNVQDKREILLKKLIDHLRYAISLYDFVKFSNQRINFETWTNKEQTLWNWRNKENSNLAFVVTPSIAPPLQYSSNSVDLRLGWSFLVNVPSSYTHIDPSDESTSLSGYYKEVQVPICQEFILHPHQFVLASIMEYVCLPHDYYGLVLGRSTWGRLGLNIATASTVQAGYRGCLTLELRNLGESPLPLTVGTRIAQLCLIKVPKEESETGYLSSSGKYIGPVKAEIPKAYSDPDWSLLKSFKNENTAKDYL